MNRPDLCESGREGREGQQDGELNYERLEKHESQQDGGDGGDRRLQMWGNGAGGPRRRMRGRGKIAGMREWEFTTESTENTKTSMMECDRLRFGTTCNTTMCVWVCARGKVGRSVLAEPQSVVRHMGVHRLSVGLMMGFLVTIYGHGSPGTRLRPRAAGLRRGTAPRPTRIWAA